MKKKSNICSFFPSQLICSSPSSGEEEEQIIFQNLIFWVHNSVMCCDSVRYVFFWRFFVISIRLLENGKFSDLFLFFQPGENSRGTEHFSSWEHFSEEQIFWGNVHWVRLVNVAFCCSSSDWRKDAPSLQVVVHLIL